MFFCYPAALLFNHFAVVFLFIRRFQQVAPAAIQIKDVQA
jgi:hypothetical protein